MILNSFAAFLLLLCVGEPVSLQQVRSGYVQAVEHQEAAEKLFVLLADIGPDDDAVLLGYRGVAQTLLARHYLSPYRKYQFFKNGTSDLEAAIKKQPNSLELRYLRFAVQSNCPAFLGYRAELSDDKSVILQLLLDQQRLPTGFEDHILHFMLQSEHCSVAEKSQLKPSERKKG